MLTVQDVKNLLPKKTKSVVSKELVDSINNLAKDPEAAGHIKDNMILYKDVLASGKYTVESYMNAIMYVTYKHMRLSNEEAYKKTFPDRYDRLVKKGYSSREIGSYVSAYNSNKLVNQILESSLIPAWLLNQGAYQEAINTQVALMKTASSEMVRMQAANSILTHLKRPEEAKLSIDITTNKDSMINRLDDTLAQLADMHKKMIEGGRTTKEILHAPLLIADDVEEAEIV